MYWLTGGQMFMDFPSDICSPSNVLDLLGSPVWDSDYFLNQVRAWFLKIDPLQIVGMRVCVCPRPRLLITSGVMWHDMDLI